MKRYLMMLMIVAVILLSNGCSQKSETNPQSPPTPQPTPTSITLLKWAKTFGGIGADIAYSVQQTTDGGYIVAGVTYSFGLGNGDAYLIKTDANGNCVWAKTYGGIDYDDFFSVKQVQNGGYIASGYTASSTAGPYLIKTFINGTSAWGKVFSGYRSWFVNTTSDGGYIITGNDFYDMILIKTDSNGSEEWTKKFGGWGNEDGYSVQQTSDSGYIVCGYTSSYGAGGIDIYLVKTDSNGNTQWTATYGSQNNEIGYSVYQTNDNGYIIVGETNSYATAKDVYLIKTDANGNSLWTKTFGGGNDDEGRTVQQTSDGGYIITGATYSYGAGNRDVYLIKTDASGNEVWSKTYGDSNADFGVSVQQTSDGGYIIAGGTYSYGAGNSDFYLIKTDANGNTTNP